MSDSDNDLYDPAGCDTVGSAATLESVSHVACTTLPPLLSEKSAILTSSQFISPNSCAPVPPSLMSSVASPPKVESTPSSLHMEYHLSGVTGRVRSVCIDSSGSRLCAGGDGGNFCMWDFTAPLESRVVKPTRVLMPFPNRISGFQSIVSVHAACDGSHFVACQDGDSPVLIASSGKQLGYCAMGERGMVDVIKCRGHRAPVTCSAPSPTVASCFFSGSQDGSARMWDVATFDRHSVYAVKHGSGQLLENVVVESIIPIFGLSGNQSVFATGGEDGFVQLWDTRQKYRPRGEISAMNFYSGKADGKGKPRTTVDEPFFEEKHVGGMAEPDPSRPMLCVRCSSTVRVVDLRKMSKSGAVEDVCPPLTDLSFSTDTTPVVSCTSAVFSNEKPSFMTCTSRSGYHHVVGGHVVQFTYLNGNFQPTMAWRPEASEEDVLSVAIDVRQGQVFAGMQGGNVAGRIRRIGVDMVPTSVPTIQTWLATRPEREVCLVGRKRQRVDAGGEDEYNEIVF